MGGWADQLLLLGVATARVAATFLLLPMFSTETVPALVRNSIFVSLGLVSLALQPPLDPSLLGPAQWATIMLKEVFVGLVIGFFFGSVLWALEAAGNIIDTKVGATLAQVVDPLSGHQTSLNGAFLGRLASVVFIAGGGLSLLLRVMMESYAIWPIAAPMPVLTVLFLIDAGLGLMNRFAQQLNVFTLSMSLKAFAATFVLLLLLGSYVTAILRDMAARPGVIRAILTGLAT